MPFPEQDLISSERFSELFCNDVPLLDVRAPVEFAQGAFPTATNIAILNDAERSKVGTRYKMAGQDAAIQLGHKLVSGEKRENRIGDWIAFAKQHPHGALYCFRGGLRSKTAQEWLRESGILYPRIAGGYKALRQFLIGSLEQQSLKSHFIVVSGRTGTGKTPVVRSAPLFIDLEDIANHRGSAFGGFPEGQPKPINFENHLAIAFLKNAAAAAPGDVYTIEDEGPNVGSLSVPKTLYEKMNLSPIAVIEESLECRVERVLAEYVIGMSNRYESCGGLAAFSDYLTGSVKKTAKRLGGERLTRVLSQMEAAIALQKTNGGVEKHRDWIRILLSEYYDPLYDSQIARKCDRIVFRGSGSEVTQWLQKK